MEELNKCQKITVDTNNVSKLLKEQLRDHHSTWIIPRVGSTPYASKRKKHKK